MAFTFETQDVGINGGSKFIQPFIRNDGHMVGFFPFDFGLIGFFAIGFTRGFIALIATDRTDHPVFALNRAPNQDFFTIRTERHWQAD